MEHSIQVGCSFLIAMYTEKGSEKMNEIFEKRKKMIYDFICDEFYVPMKIKEFAILLQVPKEERGELKKILDSLEAEGKIRVSKKGKYVKGEAKSLVGTYQAHQRGFGFVTVEGEDEDIFIQRTILTEHSTAIA